MKLVKHCPFHKYFPQINNYNDQVDILEPII